MQRLGAELCLNRGLMKVSVFSLVQLLVAFANLLQTTVSFVLPVRPSRPRGTFRLPLIGFS